MLIETRELDSAADRVTDVCVIGAGAAGITLARALTGAGIGVCVLESGGLAPELETQQLNRGSIGGLPYAPLEAARLRALGGTTGHWSGWCRPFEASDFEKRPWVPDSGWPFGRAELDPFYGPAFELVRAGPGATTQAAAKADARATGATLAGADVENMVFWLSPPARFGTLYRKDLESARNVEVLLHATATRLVTAKEGGAIERVEVAAPGGRRFSVRARSYVLAAGGIENPRLLLASPSPNGKGLGNEHDLVGRYFMDHAGIPVGTAMVFGAEAALRFYDRHVRAASIGGAPAPAIGAIRLTDAAVRRRELLNGSVLLEETDRSEAFGLRGLGGADESAGQVARNFFAYSDDAIADAWRKAFRPEERGRLFRVVSILEPSPNRESRVVLTRERDALGMPRVRLDWRLKADDRRTAMTTLDLLSRALGGAGTGRVLIRLDEASGWPPLPEGRISHGWHHMGTTRMHDDPRSGVVDRNCRVHGLGNLYVAGSSVFPTYGFAQPTLTVVALALRLAQHLNAQHLKAQRPNEGSAG
jgi:choline dehydrogenase-like flavoprotein